MEPFCFPFLETWFMLYWVVFRLVLLRVVIVSWLPFHIRRKRYLIVLIPRRVALLSLVVCEVVASFFKLMLGVLVRIACHVLLLLLDQRCLLFYFFEDVLT